MAFTARRGFEHILPLWKDQRFAELYEFGTFASQVDLSSEAFERYMLFRILALSGVSLEFPGFYRPIDKGDV